MATPANATEFLDLVRKSGVADEKRLEAYLTKLRGTGSWPSDVTKFAAMLVREAILTQFQAEQLLQGKWKRFSIGKYKVLERLGSGGMGSVFLCEHKLMRRRVAVKVLPSAKAADEESLGRFYREARAVAALDHPNIVQAYDIDQDDNLHFIVMEYVDGTNLQDLVKKTGRLPVSQACQYIQQAALGLEHAHQKNLVHRDIKPGNILIDRKGQIKILDMGLARFFNDEEDLLTRKFDDNVLGTADYLSPEQAEDSHDVDIRADIYSLGATFYFLLTGKTAFGDGTVAQKLMWHQHKDPRPVMELRPEVPAGVWTVLSKMMAKKPENRYQVPREVADALAPFSSGAVLAPPESEMPHLSPAAMEPPSDTRSSLDTSTIRPPVADPVPAPVTTAAQGQPLLSTPTVEEGAPWESLAADGVDYVPRAETSSSSRSRPTKPPLPDNMRLILVSGLVTLLCVVLLTVAALRYMKIAEPVPVRAARPVLVVTRQPGKNNSYRTIGQALRNAQKGDVIELQDEVHEENLIVDPASNMETEVTLQAAPGKAILWSPTGKDQAAYLIYLYKARNFRLNGKGITLDGRMKAGGQLRDLVFITSQCSGLTLEGIRLQDFTRSAVTIMNSMGTREAPIRLLDLHVVAAAKTTPLAGIYLDANPKMQPAYNDFLEIDPSSEFLGLDPERQVKRKDDSAVGNNINWKFTP